MATTAAPTSAFYRNTYAKSAYGENIDLELLRKLLSSRSAETRQQ